MTPGRRLLAALVTLCGAVAGPVVVAAGPAAAAEPSRWALRHSATGWIGVVSTGAGLVTCPDAAPACTDPAGAPVGTEWVDTDGDGATFASSKSRLTLPPKATVEWAGLFWTGDRGSTRDGSPARCDTAPAGNPAPTTTAPPAPDRADRVKIKLNKARYAEVKAVDLRTADGPASTEFQGYADITAILKRKQPPAQALPMDLTVADVQAAKGVACAAGWQAVLVYAYPDGPNATHAPAYRSISIFDGITAVTGAAPPALQLEGLLTGGEETMDARVSAALLASGGPVARDTFTVNGSAVAGALPDGAAEDLGYRAVNLVVPEGVIPHRATSATLGFGPARDAFLAGVVTVSNRLPVRVDLAVTTAVTPESVSVGGQASVTVTVRNDAGVPATGVTVTARLPVGLTLISAPPVYHPATGAWRVGTVGPSATKTLSLRVRVDAIGSFVNAAEVTASDTPDIDSTPGDGAGTPEKPQDDYAQVTLTGLETPTTPTPEPSEQPQAVPPTGNGLPLNMPPVALFGIGIFALGLMMFMIVVRRGRTA